MGFAREEVTTLCLLCGCGGGCGLRFGPGPGDSIAKLRMVDPILTGGEVNPVDLRRSKGSDCQFSLVAMVTSRDDETVHLKQVSGEVFWGFLVRVKVEHKSKGKDVVGCWRRG